MRPLCILVAILMTATGASSGEGPGPKMTRKERTQAAELLRHSVTELIVSPDDVPQRAARIVALSEFAGRLDAEGAETSLLLANIHGMRAQPKPALAAMDRYLASFPDDYAISTRWLDLKLDLLNTADERIRLLSSVVLDESRPHSLRSLAAAEKAGILARQGRKAGAVDAFHRSLELEASNAIGLRGLLAMRDSPSAAEFADALLGQIRGSPRDFALAWQLAQLLGSVGLHKLSLEVFDYANALASEDGRIGRAAPRLRAEYCSAMLDAGKYKRATEVFESDLSAMTYNGDLHSLMVEAYKKLGREGEAQRTIRVMEANYRAMESGADWRDMGAVHAEIAWFHLVTKPDPDRALAYARKAQLAENGPVLERILGAAEMAVGNEHAGAARLSKLVSQDAYAAAILAEHYSAEGDLALAGKAIQSGLALVRSGPAFRKLRAVAASRGQTIPLAEGGDEARQVYEASDKSFMKLALTPEGCVSVRFQPRTKRFGAGQPVSVDAVLSNIGQASVPLDGGGLFRPRMSLQVSVNGPGLRVFDNLPMAVWPAPGRLVPGQTVSVAVRLDVGKLAKFLRERPLDDLALTVTGMLDPVKRGRKFVSSLPPVKPEPVSVLRQGLVIRANGSKPVSQDEGYRLALGRIVRDLRRGDLMKRIAAARQIASLLCFAQKLRQGQAELSDQLKGKVSKPVMLSLLQAALQDESPVVRAQMVAELSSLSADGEALGLVGDLIEDPSALVRMRVAELVGMSQSEGSGIVLSHLAEDSDELVSTMAKAFANSASSGGDED